MGRYIKRHRTLGLITSLRCAIIALFCYVTLSYTTAEACGKAFLPANSISTSIDVVCAVQGNRFDQEAFASANEAVGIIRLVVCATPVKSPGPSM